jgi:hypothetical protein
MTTINGARQFLSGGNDAGTDTLEFINGGNIDIDIEPGSADQGLTGIEVFDFAGNAAFNDIHILFDNQMIYNNVGNLLTIKINDNDYLNLDLSGLGYSETNGDTDLTAGANFVE